MTPSAWFEALTEAMPGPPTAVGDDEREHLLALARVAAHASERWVAPITTYVAGVALAGVPAPERAEILGRVVTMLEDRAE